MNSIFNTRTAVGNLLIANSVVFLAQMLLRKGGYVLTFLCPLYYPESPLFHIWQPITYMFLHGNIEHFFFNMFALWMFGRRIEYDLGTRHFLIYYFVCGIGAAITHTAVAWLEIQSESPDVIQAIMQTPTLGASGAIYGILLAYGLMHPNDEFLLLIPPIPVKALWLVIGYGVIELFSGIFSFDNVAHFAHLGGMIFGFIILWYWKKRNVIFY